VVNAVRAIGEWRRLLSARHGRRELLLGGTVMMRTVARFGWVIALGLVAAAGCIEQPSEPDERVGRAHDEVKPSGCPEIAILCAPGSKPKLLPNCKQICIPDNPPEPGPGEQCGDKICPHDQYCCNASCEICVPEGWGCIQIACVQT